MEVLLGFWEQVEEVWRRVLFDIGMAQILIALCVFIAFVFLRGIFSSFFIGLLTRLTKKTRTTLDDRLLDALEQPLRFVFFVLGIYVATRVAQIPPEAELFVLHVVRSMIAFTIFWAIYRCIDPCSFLFSKALGRLGHHSLGHSLQDFFAKLAKFVVACVGVVAILEEWDFNVGAVLGGLGLVGMAVAFGAQNLITNLFSGLSIFLDGIFEKGDWICAGDIEGTVEEIGFRTTKIRRFDKALTTIPNSKLAGEAVVNFSRMSNRRIYWNIGVEYGATDAQLREIVNEIRQYIFNSTEFETDPDKVTTLIHIDNFGDSSIGIMLYCFTHTTNWNDWMEIKENLALRIKEIVEDAGSSFAFPSTSVYIEKTPFGKPDIFPSCDVK